MDYLVGKSCEEFVQTVFIEPEMLLPIPGIGKPTTYCSD
jgi:hypothetical protein